MKGFTERGAPTVDKDGVEQPGQHGIFKLIMILVGLLLIYLGIAKKFEPLLLLPIGFGGILANIPYAGIAEPGGFLYAFYEMGIGDVPIFPLLIFLGVGAMTDFGPLLANPKTALLGAAAQFGIFTTLIGALWLSSTFGSINFSIQDASAIGIIGGADGIDPELRGRADFKLSFGSMVWPHMLARVMLAEQLYRAASILSGSPYHRV